MSRSPLVAVLGLLALTSPAAAQGKIAWEKTLAGALERAKTENKPLAACISMKGERVCDVIVAEHYADPVVVALSKHTVNVFCSPHGTAAQQELEKRVRLDLLQKDAASLMIAPQHVFFAPDGVVISSVPYYVTIGELEWIWANALQTHDPKFSWEASERARAPAALKKKKAEVSREVAKPPTAKELEAMLREIKRGFGGYYGAREKMPVIVRHPGQPARRFVQRLLDAFETRPAERVEVLQIIGRSAPREWWAVVVPFLANDDDGVRRQAATTLGQLGEKSCAKALHARWSKEASIDVRCALVHAMVACAPADRRVLELLPFLIKDHESETLRVQATAAAASLESRKVVEKSLTAALADGAGKVRSAAAYAIASRRDTALRPALEAAADSEQDAETKGWMEKALVVLEGGDLEVFDPLVESLKLR